MSAQSLHAPPPPPPPPLLPPPPPLLPPPPPPSVGVVGDSDIDHTVSPAPAAEAGARRPDSTALANLAMRIAHVQRAMDGVDQALSQFRSLVEAFGADGTGRLVSDLAASEVASASNAPVMRVVNLILAQAVRDRASDLHFEPMNDRVRVRYRIDGVLHDSVSMPAGMASGLTGTLRAIARLNVAESGRKHGVRFDMTIDGHDIMVGLSTARTVWGEKCVIRLTDRARPMLHMDDLGMSNEQRTALSQLLRSPSGLLLFVGPNRAGKTATSYAALETVDERDRDRNIMTIEDPVEYVLPSINQIEVNETAGETFAGGLKSLLTQDPDVILVGEIADAETARLAVVSALSGRLVLTSLHAADPAAALRRLVDMGISAPMVAASVIGVVNQRLLRRICPSCQAPYQPSDEEITYYAACGGEPKDVFFHGEGCPACVGTGYHERIGIFELVHGTAEIDRILGGGAAGQGVRTLQAEADSLIANNVTTIAEVMRTLGRPGASQAPAPRVHPVPSHRSRPTLDGETRAPRQPLHR